MYFVSNNHEAIVSKEIFDRTQEEMQKRISKKKVADKFTKGEQGKYSGKYALSELLICAECGTSYRRVTWTAKGYREIKWRCISRLQYGSDYCKDSPTLDESVLHEAIVIAINKFLSVKNEVAEMLEQNINEVLNPNFSETISNAENRIKKIQKIIMELVTACSANGDAEKHIEEFERLKNETDGLREFIKLEKTRAEQASNDNSKTDLIIQSLRETDFKVREYDDIIVRHLIEGIKVINKTKILLVFKSGFEMEQAVNIL